MQGSQAENFKNLGYDNILPCVVFHLPAVSWKSRQGRMKKVPRGHRSSVPSARTGGTTVTRPLLA